jgi:hypothetical protein
MGARPNAHSPGQETQAQDKDGTDVPLREARGLSGVSSEGQSRGRCPADASVGDRDRGLDRGSRQRCRKRGASRLLPEHIGAQGGRQCHSPPSQSGREQLPRTRDPTGKGSLPTTESLHRLFARSALQAAEHKRTTVLLRQTLHLFVEDRLEFAPHHVVRRRYSRRNSPLMTLAAAISLFHFHRNSVGDAVEPAAHRLGLFD